MNRGSFSLAQGASVYSHRTVFLPHSLEMSDVIKKLFTVQGTMSIKVEFNKMITYSPIRRENILTKPISTIAQIVLSRY